MNTRAAQLSTARSVVNICYSTKLRESKNTNFGFVLFTSDPRIWGRFASNCKIGQFSEGQKWVRSKWQKTEIGIFGLPELSTITYINARSGCQKLSNPNSDIVKKVIHHS